MKALEKRIAAHARAHVTILKARRHETYLTEPQAQLIIERIENVLEQLPAAIERLIDQQQIIPGNVWGDRGTASVSNTRMLDKRGIGNGLCPRNVIELTDKLATREGFREGLKRRAATEGRIGIFKNVFLGRPLLDKGFGHRELAVGWAVLIHKLWVVARMAAEEKNAKRIRKRKPGQQSPAPPDAGSVGGEQKRDQARRSGKPVPTGELISLITARFRWRSPPKPRF